MSKPIVSDIFQSYLGDGVYADYDGHHIVLTTEVIGEITNKIYLEPSVTENLRRYSDGLKNRISEFHIIRRKSDDRSTSDTKEESN